MDKERFIEIILQGLERIIFEGEFGLPQNFVIFEFGSKYYLQIAAARGDEKVYCEAVGNGFMLPEDFIDANQIERLTGLGWSESKSEENHTIEMPCDSIQSRRDLAELFYHTAEIYGTTEIENVQVNIG